MTDKIEHVYTERDLQIAAELSALTKVVLNLNDKITEMLRAKEEDHKAMWSKLDRHADKIEGHGAMLKWIIGLGLGIQGGWVFLTNFFKH